MVCLVAVKKAIIWLPRFYLERNLDMRKNISEKKKRFCLSLVLLLFSYIFLEAKQTKREGKNTLQQISQ